MRELIGRIFSEDGRRQSTSMLPEGESLASGSLIEQLFENLPSLPVENRLLLGEMISIQKQIDEFHNKIISLTTTLNILLSDSFQNIHPHFKLFMEIERIKGRALSMAQRVKKGKFDPETLCALRDCFEGKIDPIQSFDGIGRKIYTAFLEEQGITSEVIESMLPNFQTQQKII